MKDAIISKRNLQSLAIISIALVILIVQKFLFPFPERWQWIFFIITMFVTGLPHGAFDYLVAKQQASSNHKSFSVTRFYTHYLFKMIAYAVGWYFFPVASLVLFLLLSAYHFGESDLLHYSAAKRSLKELHKVFHGASILLVLIISDATISIPIINGIIKDYDSSALLHQLEPYTYILPAINCVIAWILYRNTILHTIYYIITYLIIIIIISSLPLPLGFALYFSCWHSINTLTDIHQFLTNNHVQKKQLWHILKSGSPFILLTWAGIVIALYGIQQSSQPQNILSLLFISISILTLPHVGVMSIMLNKHSKQSQN